MTNFEKKQLATTVNFLEKKGLRAMTDNWGIVEEEKTASERFRSRISLCEREKTVRKTKGEMEKTGRISHSCDGNCDQANISPVSHLRGWRLVKCPLRSEQTAVIGCTYTSMHTLMHTLLVLFQQPEETDPHSQDRVGYKMP